MTSFAASPKKKRMAAITLEQFLNRIHRNQARLNSYLKQNRITAFRLYDQDIPEMPFTIDSYDGHLIINDRTESWEDAETKLQLAKTAMQQLLKPGKELFVKRRETQTRHDKYEKLEARNFTIKVNEGALQFEVNLSDYIDTGLFLDHRPLRKLLGKTKEPVNVLNLFSYTCSLGAAAAITGCRTTNIDLSAKYLNWGEKNYQLNNLSLQEHRFIAADILQWLQTNREKFDLIIFDPPSFSNSKKMLTDFDVLRDHEQILLQLKEQLNPHGSIYFSNNLRSFKLNPNLTQQFHVFDLSQESIPPDFQDQKIHKLYQLRPL